MTTLNQTYLGNNNYQFNPDTQTLTAKRDAPYYIFFSDIHGNANTIKLIYNAQHDFNNACLIGGGDYIDGRKDSLWVTQNLQHMTKYSNSVILKGNHEQMMIDYADGIDGLYEDESLWLWNGGKTTLKSYFSHKKRSRQELRELLKNSSYYSFYKNAPIIMITPHYIFVHAGVIPVSNFNDPAIYPKYKKYYYTAYLDGYNGYRLWARDEYFLDQQGKYLAHNKTGKTIVSGHTPTFFVKGKFDDGRILEETPKSYSIVKKIQYVKEPARIVTDGLCHPKYPQHFGNVTVLDDIGNIVAIYDFLHPDGISWTEYAKHYKHFMAHKK